MDDFVLAGDVVRLHRLTTAKLHRALVERFAVLLPRPEKSRGRDIDPLEAAVDLVEVRGDEIANLRAELVDQERAAWPDNLRRRLGDRIADTRRKSRERKPRQDEIGLGKATDEVWRDAG